MEAARKMRGNEARDAAGARWARKLCGRGFCVFPRHLGCYPVTRASRASSAPLRRLRMTYRVLSLHDTTRWEIEARALGVSLVARSQSGFLPAFKRAGGDLSRMTPQWRAKRDAFISRHMAQVEARGEPLFDAHGEPTRRHLALIMWAYSPVPRHLDRAYYGK